MNFCQNCGARLGEGKFCGNCGHPVPSGQQATSSPVVEDATRPIPPQVDQTLMDAPTVAAAPPSRHPFGDISALDYVRDVLALVLLVASFSMPWDANGTAADRIHVVLVTLLAMASLTLPYLRRAGVLPDAWGNSEVRVARVLANVPYFVVVALTIVIDIATDGGDSGGVGVGVGFGLAGAVLAAQARHADEADDPGHGQAWRLAAVGIAAVAAALTVVRLAVVLADLSGAEPEWGPVTLALLEPVIFIAVLLVPVAALLGGRSAARDVLVALGVVAAVMGLWRMSEGSGLPEVLRIRDDGPAELLWLAIAAAVLAAGVARLLSPSPALSHWIDTAARALGLAAILAGLAALYWIVVVTSVEDGRGTSITVLVLLLLAVAAAVVGRSAVRRNPRDGRPVALAVAGVLVLIAIIDLAVETAGPHELTHVSALVVSSLFVLPALVVVALTVPRAVRDELGPVELGGASFGSQPRP
ncbi:MAG TPA: zinc ribbon domain-containing protein [Jiangellaceae bacterium]